MSADPGKQRSAGTLLGFWAVLALVTFALIELIALLASFAAGDVFDHRESVLARAADVQAESLARIDGELGWEPEPATQFEEPDCRGEPVSYRIAADGARDYPGYVAAESTVLLAGDSYTFGSETGDPQAYPAVLAGLLGESVANLGVGGYGPVQALLRLERHMGNYPAAEQVVLAIMYENVHRMMNSYRPVLYDKADVLSFKPFMRGGAVQPHPGRAAISEEAPRRREMERAFDEDFWAKPARGFPFSLSLYDALSSRYFQFRKLQKSLRKLDRPEYTLTFASAEIQQNLFGLLGRFSELVQAGGKQPVILFIPRNRLDTSSVQGLIAGQQSAFPPGAVVLDLATADVDWSRFNLENPADGNICHPSAYGYEQIARFLADALP